MATDLSLPSRRRSQLRRPRPADDLAPVTLLFSSPCPDRGTDQHSGRCRRPDPEVVSEFTADVWRAANTLVAHMRRVLDPYGLTFAQHEVLRHICEYDTATVNAIAGRLGLPSDQVAQIVTFLAGRHLVRADGGCAAATHHGHALSAELQRAISVEESLLLCPHPVQQVWATSELLASAAGRAGQLGPHACRQATTSDR